MIATKHAYFSSLGPGVFRLNDSKWFWILVVSFNRFFIVIFYKWSADGNHFRKTDSFCSSRETDQSLESTHSVANRYGNVEESWKSLGNWT